jgi:hypothetical protein
MISGKTRMVKSPALTPSVPLLVVLDHQQHQRPESSTGVEEGAAAASRTPPTNAPIGHAQRKQHEAA